MSTCIKVNDRVNVDVDLLQWLEEEEYFEALFNYVIGE